MQLGVLISRQAAAKCGARSSESSRRHGLPVDQFFILCRALLGVPLIALGSAEYHALCGIGVVVQKVDGSDASGPAGNSAFWTPWSTSSRDFPWRGFFCRAGRRETKSRPKPPAGRCPTRGRLAKTTVSCASTRASHSRLIFSVWLSHSGPNTCMGLLTEAPRCRSAMRWTMMLNSFVQKKSGGKAGRGENAPARPQKPTFRNLLARMRRAPAGTLNPEHGGRHRPSHAVP